MKKFNKKAWQIIEKLITSSPYQYGYELHHLVKGRKEEALNLVIPLTVDDHRGKGHAKNWFDSKSVPEEEKFKAYNFWLALIKDDEDLKYFERNGIAWK